MFKTILLTASGALALAGCSGSMPDPSASQEAVDPVPTGVPAAVTSASTDAPAAPPAPVGASVTPAPPLAEPIDKTQQGARAVLVTWGRALENHQFPLAWAQFINPPASQSDFTLWWQRYRTIRVTLGPGEGDAAMGSIYYTAPATLTGTTVAGKPFHLEGDVVVRRVNDVDGATPAQLRWHIGSADLKDVGP